MLLEAKLQKTFFVIQRACKGQLPHNAIALFASVTLSALDVKPIAQSARLLLTACAMAGNSGMQWNEARSALTQSGTAPTLIEPVTGQLLLRNLTNARNVTIAALDGRGHRIGAPVAATKTADGWQLPLGAAVTTWYEIVVER